MTRHGRRPALLAPLSALATWSNATLLDTDEYVAPLAEDPAVQDEISRRITDAVFGPWTSRSAPPPPRPPMRNDRGWRGSPPCCCSRRSQAWPRRVGRPWSSAGLRAAVAGLAVLAILVGDRPSAGDVLVIAVLVAVALTAIAVLRRWGTEAGIEADAEVSEPASAG